MSIDKIREVIEANITDRYNEGAAISNLLLAEPNKERRVQMLSYLIQNYGIIESTGKSVPLADRTMTRDRWDELRKIDGNLIDAQIRRAFFNFPSAEEASQRLIAIFESLPDGESKDFFIANILADKRVPYLELPSGRVLVKMENNRFLALNKKLVRHIRQIEYVIKAADYEQKTERASHLLSILNSVVDMDEKVVLMVHILNVPEETAQQLLLANAFRR